MPSAIVLGVSGAVGAAAATALVEQGWDVVGTGRDDRRFPARLQGLGVRFVRSERHINADVASVLASGADLVVDCVGYTAAHARMVLEHRFDIGSVVFVSSKAVYVDERGRHSNTLEQPDFGGPIHESQPTLDPSDEHYDSPTGYGANKVAAELAYLNSDLQCSVLRPSRVHGVDATNPREWVFVKRPRRSSTTPARPPRGRGQPSDRSSQSRRAHRHLRRPTRHAGPQQRRSGRAERSSHRSGDRRTLDPCVGRDPARRDRAGQAR